MSLFKKIKNVAKALNPVTYFTTDMGLKALKGENPLKTGEFFAKNPGPDNPFNPADKSALFDTSRIDFLKDPSQFDFLKGPGATNPYMATLPNSYKSFASGYNPGPRTSDAMFDDYLNNVNAPSSVDEVQSGVDSDLMRQILEGIDTDTKNTVGSLKSDFADRGLGGPGVISDIEGNSLAQAYGDANKTKASARGEFATKELDRMKAKEEAAREAYKTRYGVGANFDTQDRTIAAQGAMSDSNMFNDLLKSQASLAEGGLNRDVTRGQNYADILKSRGDLFAQLLNSRDLGAYNIASGDYNSAEDRKYKYQDPSMFDKLLDKINIGFAL